MYVCVCKQVTERDLAEAVEKGAKSVDDLQQYLAVATDCGQCADFAEQAIAQLMRKQT